MTRSSDPRNVPSAALGAAPTAAPSVCRWYPALGVHAALALGATTVVAARTGIAASRFDPAFAAAMVASVAAVAGIAVWTLRRKRCQWITAAAFVGGLVAALVVVATRGPGLEDDYVVWRCLEGNRSACESAAVGGLPRGDDAGARRVLVVACEGGFDLACYRLLDIEPGVACRISRDNCASALIHPEARRRACHLVEDSCGAPESTAPPRVKAMGPERL